MAELGVFRIRDVEAVIDDQLVEDVFGELAMDRQVVLAAGELGNRPIARDDREARDARHGKRLDVIGPEEQNRVGLGLVQDPAELLHVAAGLIELLRVLVRRPREHVRRVARADGGYDFSHTCLLWGLAARGWRLEPVPTRGHRYSEHRVP